MATAAMSAKATDRMPYRRERSVRLAAGSVSEGIKEEAWFSESAEFPADAEAAGTPGEMRSSTQGAESPCASTAARFDSISSDMRFLLHIISDAAFARRNANGEPGFHEKQIRVRHVALLNAAL